MRITRLPAILFLSLAIFAAPTHAKTLRWSSQGDSLTADPHGQNEGVTNNINGQVYEGLVARGKKLEIQPQLATSWKQVNATTWILNLRKGVKFHDGSDFTADDAVFSILRAQGETSNFRVYALGVGKPRKIDTHTIELVTPVPNPVQMEMLAANIFMMSKAWAEKNKCVKAQDFKNKEENFASRNANGTGPFTLVRRDPDVKTVLKKNPNWWGLAEKRFEGNVTEVVYTPIKNDATRLSALQSNELDFVLDPPLQNIEQVRRNPQLKVVEGPEQRVLFLGMDQSRKELQYSNVKGKNPFKDVRVRRAIAHAIDQDAIRTQVMRGFSVPTGIVLPAPDLAGIPKANQARTPLDLAKAKALLKEAGYENGFEVTIDCPNNRYVNDERICIAIAGMLAKINISLKVNAMPRTTYFQKTESLDTSMYLLGWGGATTDAMFTLQPVLHSRTDEDGIYNWGQVKDAKFDALIQAARGEIDVPKRQGLIIEAMKYHGDNMFHIPLHRQVIPWATRANVSVVHRADNWLEVVWVSVK